MTFAELAAKHDVYDGRVVRVAGYMRIYGHGPKYYLFQAPSDGQSWKPFNGIVLQGDVSRFLVAKWPPNDVLVPIPGMIIAEGPFRSIKPMGEDFVFGEIDVKKIEGPPITPPQFGSAESK